MIQSRTRITDYAGTTRHTLYSTQLRCRAILKLWQKATLVFWPCEPPLLAPVIAGKRTKSLMQASTVRAVIHSAALPQAQSMQCQTCEQRVRNGGGACWSLSKGFGALVLVGIEEPHPLDLPRDVESSPRCAHAHCDGISSTMLRVYSPLWSKSFNICTSTFVRHAEELANRSNELPRRAAHEPLRRRTNLFEGARSGVNVNDIPMHSSHPRKRAARPGVPPEAIRTLRTAFHSPTPTVLRRDHGSGPARQ